MLRSLLDPRLADALDQRPGSATPLAHGLELARLALTHALRHGRTPVAEATLVVVTDALGNVPLAASLREEVSEPVGAEGIEDALTVGRDIATMDRVRPIVVAPPHAPYPDLPVELARSFGPHCLVVAGE
jgi:magnesium chelatase subunit D